VWKALSSPSPTRFATARISPIGSSCMRQQPN
jgi:hypothetical protein